MLQLQIAVGVDGPAQCVLNGHQQQMHLAVADRLTTGRSIKAHRSKKSLKATRNESLCFFSKKYPPKLPPKRRKSFIKGWIAHGFHSFPAHQGIGRLLASSALETICGAKTKVGSLGQFCLRMLISNAWRIRICQKNHCSWKIS